MGNERAIASKSESTLPQSFYDDGFVTSIQLAEMAGKKHSNFMRDIRRMTEGFTFAETQALDMHEETYSDSLNRRQAMYVLGKTAIRFVLSATDHHFRMRLLVALDRLEQEAQQRLEAARKQVVEQRNHAEDVLLRVSTFDKRAPHRGDSALRDEQKSIMNRRRYGDSD